MLIHFVCSQTDHLDETVVFAESSQDETNDAADITWKIFHDLRHFNFFLHWVQRESTQSSLTGGYWQAAVPVMPLMVHY